MTALPANRTIGPGENLLNLNSTSKIELTPFETVMEQIASGLSVAYIPLLVVLGAVGNLLSVFVFYKSKLRFQSTSQYLSALAISDTLFLLQLIPPWLLATHSTGIFHQNGFCQIFVYMSYVTCTFSAWIVVSFTVERFLAVIYPLRCNVICTVRRSRYVITGIALGSLLINVPVLRFATPTLSDCNIDYEYLVHAARFNIVDTAASFTVPLAVIIVLNVWIVVGVYRIERERQELVRARQNLALESRLEPLRQMGYTRSQTRVTRMLLLVSSVFVILNLPAYTMRIIAYAYDMNNGEGSPTWIALQQIALMFFNTNFGINFTLYCLSGQNFRRALRNTMPKCGREVQRNNPLRELSITANAGSARNSVISNEASGSCEAPVARANPRPRRDDQYITRWTFDNSRQRRAQARSTGNPESFELRPIGPPLIEHGSRALKRQHRAYLHP